MCKSNITKPRRRRARTVGLSQQSRWAAPKPLAYILNPNYFLSALVFLPTIYGRPKHPRRAFLLARKDGISGRSDIANKNKRRRRKRGMRLLARWRHVGVVVGAAKTEARTSFKFNLGFGATVPVLARMESNGACRTFIRQSAQRFFCETPPYWEEASAKNPGAKNHCLQPGHLTTANWDR